MEAALTHEVGDGIQGHISTNSNRGVVVGCIRRTPRLDILQRTIEAFVVSISNRHRVPDNAEDEDRPPDVLLSLDVPAQPPEKEQEGELDEDQDGVEEDLDGELHVEPVFQVRDDLGARNRPADVHV